MTLSRKPVTSSAHNACNLMPQRQDTAADMKSTRQLPPLTNGLFNNLFHLVARQTAPSDPDVQVLSLVPPSPNR